MSLLILTGPSCAGKSSVSKILCDAHGYEELKSHTTRPRRRPEEEDYYFVDEEEFNSLDFVERVEYAGNLYGMSKNALDRVLSEPQKNFIAIVESHGAKQILDAYGYRTPICRIFIDTPDDHIKRRLEERGADTTNRLARLHKDRAEKAWHTFQIDNPDGEIENTVQSILSIVEDWHSSERYIAQAFCDGSGKGSCGYTIKVNGVTYLGLSSREGITSNEAEYLGLCEVLAALKKLQEPVRSGTITMDSLLVVAQVNGTYRVKNEKLRGWNSLVVERLRELPFPVAISWSSRETEGMKNADKLSRK